MVLMLTSSINNHLTGNFFNKKRLCWGYISNGVDFNAVIINSVSRESKYPVMSSDIIYNTRSNIIISTAVITDF